MLLDPSKTKMVSYLAMKLHPWQMEKVFQRRFEPSHFLHTWHTRGAFARGKCHPCNLQLSLPSCQSTEVWEDCGLQWNPTWNAQSLK